MEEKEELLQTLQTGVASKEGQESGYQGQLQEAKNRASAASTEQEQAKLKISHLEKQIKEDEPRAKKAKEQNSGLMKDLEALSGFAGGVEVVAKVENALCLPSSAGGAPLNSNGMVLLTMLFQVCRPLGWGRVRGKMESRANEKE